MKSIKPKKLSITIGSIITAIFSQALLASNNPSTGNQTKQQISPASTATQQKKTEEKKSSITTPLDVKIFCSKESNFINDTEKPLNFKPFEDGAQYSWVYKKNQEPHTRCYVLIGYADNDKDDAQVAAVKILMGQTPSPTTIPVMPVVAAAGPQQIPQPTQPPSGPVKEGKK